MKDYSNNYIRILLITIIFCAVMGSPVAAQDYNGRRDDISTSKRLKLQNFSDLPVRVLLTDAIYSESALSYHNKNGKLYLYQQPETAQNFSLASYGLTSFKNLRLEGNFQYQKQLHDDVGWKLVRDAYQEPYYYGNIHPGDWDNDLYTLHLNGGTTFFDDRLVLGLGADYEVERLTRYNDPRPSINYYNLFWKTQLGWRIQNHTLALYYGSGNTDENGSVSNFYEANDSFGRREYNIITVSGIGSYSLQRRNSYTKPKNRTEIGATYQYKSDSFELTTEAKSITNTTYFNSRRVDDGEVILQRLGKYYEDAFEGRLFLSIPVNDRTFQVMSKTKWSDGYDTNPTYAGTNYFHQNLRQKLRFFYYNADESLALQIGGGLNDQSFTDRNTSHDFKYQRINSDASLQYSMHIGERTVAFIPGISYSFATSHSISVPESSRNMLTNYLVSPEYYLHTSDIAGLRAGFQIKQNFENLALGLLIKYQRQMIINEGIEFGEPAYMPGNNRNSLSLTLQFFH